ncbi:MAG: hypothetical protein ACKOPC_00150, partial [Methylocystis sp.]
LRIIVFLEAEGLQLRFAGFADLVDMLDEAFFHFMLPHNFIIAIFDSVSVTGVYFGSVTLALRIVSRTCDLSKAQAQYQASRGHYA